MDDVRAENRVTAVLRSVQSPKPSHATLPSAPPGIPQLVVRCLTCTIRLHISRQSSCRAAVVEEDTCASTCKETWCHRRPPRRCPLHGCSWSSNLCLVIEPPLCRHPSHHSHLRSAVNTALKWWRLRTLHVACPADGRSAQVRSVRCFSIQV